MSDPFAILREELVRVASRAPAASRPDRWAWLRRRPRPLAVCLAALVVCGSAAAGVLSLSASPSQPLAGRVPGAIEPASMAGYQYTITVTPSLDAGAAGWTASITYSRHGTAEGGESGGGNYPSATVPIFGGAGFGLTFSYPPQSGDTVGFVLTGPQVAAVRLGTRTIQTFSSAQLPAGDRAAVFFRPANAPALMVGWAPGQPIRASVPVPWPPSGHLKRIPTLAVLPLDAAGKAIPAPNTPYYGENGPWPSFWQAPSAVTPNIKEPPYHGPTHPLPGVCELAQHGLPGLTPEWGHAMGTILTARDAMGELFVSCIDTEYYLHGWPLQAAVLLDGRQPGQVLGDLPGARPVRGFLDSVDVAGADLTARRVGNAWLVVQGGSGLVQRLEVLGALRVSKLDLSSVSAH